MRLTELQVDRLRNLRQARLALEPGINVITGDNGAGKTSLIEAVHLLSHGRSFRSVAADALIQVGADRFEVFVRARDGGGRVTTLGVARDGQSWTLRHNAQPVPLLTDFVRHLAAVTVEPNSHTLITGPAEVRRRYLDWLLFHVEPDFLVGWRRYLRALKQRNAGLQRRLSDAELAVWEAEMSAAGELIHRQRVGLLTRLQARVVDSLAAFAPSLVPLRWSYRAGWPSQFGNFADALADGRGADRERGFTGRGPHRADWRVAFPGGLGHAELSRGQAKLVALACLLAQADFYREVAGSWPVLLFDDLASELDQTHQGQVLSWLRDSAAQVLVSGTETPTGWRDLLPADSARFHVEQGEVQRLL